MLTVICSDRPPPGWDAFVARQPAATVAHLSAWGRVIEGAYGHASVYLSAVAGGDLVGVLPLVILRSALFGARAVSMPFLDYGGVLAKAGGGVEAALAARALAVARERGARSVGLRQLHAAALPYPVADGRVTMLVPLAAEEEAVWRALPGERRNRVRKGRKHGLGATWGGAGDLDAFYRVFAVNMRDLGSPVHSRAFFRRMLAELPAGTARVLLVRDGEGRPVGAAVCLFFRDTIMVPWVSSLREAFALCPNFVLYWEVIRFGCANGYRTLDLGRSFREAGTFEFKRQWGAAPHALPWIFVDLVAGAAPPVDRDAGRFAPLVRLWKRLPMPLANALGPWIRGQLPN